MFHLDFNTTTQFYLPYIFNVLHECKLMYRSIQIYLHVFIYWAKVFNTCNRMIVPFFAYHSVICDLFVSLSYLAWRGSSVGCESSWHDAGGPGFHPHVRHILSWRFGHKKNFPRTLSPFRWFKKSNCQLLAKEWALSTGKLPRSLAQKQCG